MASSNQFTEWKNTLNRRMREFSGPVDAPVTLEVQRGKSRTAFDMEKILEEFAIDFMGTLFVEEVFRPAFFQGEGIGGSGANAVADHMPQIERGYSVFLGRDTGGVGKDGKYSKYSESLEDLSRQQKSDASMGFDTEQESKEDQSRFNNATTDFSEFSESFEVELTGHAANWMKGFRSLFASMKRTQTAKAGSKGIQVNMGSGPEILRHKMNPYSVTRGQPSQSDYDSFFYSAEFGTGVAKNVGGAQWVRQQKKNGAEERHGMRGEPGSWWYWGKKRDETERGGGLFSGQKGLHVLFDEESREPRDIYAKWINDNLYRKLDEHLKTATRGAIRASRRR